MWHNLRDLVKYRALIRALVIRHLVQRYRGSVLGFLWSLVNPLCLMAVYTLVFHFYIRFNAVPNYAIFLLCGLLPWIWFSSGLIEGATSIVSSGHLITKSMFPAHILPTVAVLTSFIHFVLALPVLFGFMLVSGLEFHWTLVFLPVVVLLNLLFIYGLGLGLAALNVHFRDVQHIVTNVITFLFFLCPIIYPISSVPERFHFSFKLNPMAVFIDYYHKVILEGEMPSMVSIGGVSLSVILVIVLGNLIFDRYRETLAESL